MPPDHFGQLPEWEIVKKVTPSRVERSVRICLPSWANTCAWVPAAAGCNLNPSAAAASIIFLKAASSGVLNDKVRMPLLQRMVLILFPTLPAGLPAR